MKASFWHLELQQWTWYNVLPSLHRSFWHHCCSGEVWQLLFLISLKLIYKDWLHVVLLLNKECLIFGSYWCVVLFQDMSYVLSTCSGFVMKISLLKTMVVVQCGKHGSFTAPRCAHRKIPYKDTIRRVERTWRTYKVSFLLVSVNTVNFCVIWALVDVLEAAHYKHTLVRNQRKVSGFLEEGFSFGLLDPTHLTLEPSNSPFCSRKSQIILLAAE